MILDQSAKLSNIPEFSVGELAGSLKRTLEESFGRVRVRGELSRVTIASSGHMYSSLKDESAVIDAVCWKGTLSKLSLRPEEGLEVICTGRITTYPQSSKYQLVIESMEMAGEGAILKMLEDRRKKLAAEGLFDPDRKRPLPFLPDVIGVITSPTGAVIRDILHRLSDRFPRHVIVWPVLVQGQDAANQVAAAIEGFNALPLNAEGGGPIPRPDLLIVARGGGSLEDLMPFNEEIVVRAAASSQIPLISAVGHETDTTLIDHAADMRAPTPTGAAEIAVPRRDALMAQLADDAARLIGTLQQALSRRRERLHLLAPALGRSGHFIETKTQALDTLTQRMHGMFERFLRAKEKPLHTAATHLPHPRHTLEQSRLRLNACAQGLTRLAPALTRDPAVKLASLGRMLESLSFKSVLSRGFAVVQDAQGHIVSDTAALNPGDALHILLKDNQTLDAAVTGTSTE